MNPKWLHLAGDLLDEAADRLSDAGCNDWKWPVDWTSTERLALARAMVEDNVAPDRTVLTVEDEEEVEELATGDFGPPDWWVARFLAAQLQRTNDEALQRGLITRVAVESLTRREQFACAALQGILANRAWNRASLQAAGFRENTNEAMRAAAFIAFAYADTMLAEAAKGPDALEPDSIGF